MTYTAVRPGPLTVLAVAVALVLSGTGRADAQQRPATPSSGRQLAVEQGQPGSAPAPVRDNADARQTREQLETLFERYPPTLAGVLKLDPSLLTNDNYLSTYPALGAFLAQHPEVSHNPSYFLSNLRSANVWEPPDERRQMTEIIAGTMAGIAAFLVFVIVLSTLGWLIKTTLNYRRWNRLSKIQTEVHTKLLDRFSGSEELLAYMQTPGARRFLESAPIPLDAEARPLSAPLSRILWSLQVGVVLLVFGIGVLMLSARVVAELATAFAAFGVLAVALGAGFALSAFAAYAASRRLGLLEPAAGTPESRV